MRHTRKGGRVTLRSCLYDKINKVTHENVKGAQA